MSKLKLSTIFEVENIKTAEDARQVMMFLSQLLNEAVQLEQDLRIKESDRSEQTKRGEKWDTF